MPIREYLVKRGDTLWDLSKEYASSISGSSTQAKIDTLVKLNNIKNPDLILVGQKLVFSGSGSSRDDDDDEKEQTSVKFILFGLQAGDESGRAMYATWSWSRDRTENYTVRWRYYADGAWWVGNESSTSSYESEYCQSTYTAPTNAKKVRVSVKPVSEEDGDGDPYWKVNWSTEKEYDFSNNPPSVPDTPDLEIKDFTLTATIESADSEKLNAKTIEFEVIKNNTTKYKTGKANINTTTNYVSYTCTVDAGADYKVRCRAVRGNLTSAWSDFSNTEGTKPSKPSGITTCKAINYSEDEISAYLEWSAVANADTYDIEYTTNKNYFGSSDGTTTKNGIEYTYYELTGLTLGKEYFFRVRAVNDDGESDWSGISSLILGTSPAEPTTWSSTTTAIVGEPLNLYWVHNAEDGSTQTYAEVEINDGVRTETYTIRDTDGEDKTSVYTVNTSQYTEGTVIKWRVRTAGVTKAYGDWSTQRTVDIYARPTLELSVTDKNGTLVNTLTSFPFYISALAGPNTQAPIGYYVKITSNDSYETIGKVGTTKIVNVGDAMYSKYFDISEQLMIEMSADNLDLEPNMNYTITCSVTMNTGLSTDMTHDFTVKWTEEEYKLDADISIDRETMTASIIPYCQDNYGVLIDGLTLSVYRREFDGAFTELARNISNTNNTTVTDPHPALDYARYRIVAKSISTGAVSYYDVPGYYVGGDAVIIQWDDAWSTFETVDEFDVEPPAWSGSLLRLPYNIDVSDNYNNDVSLIEYAGRKRPVSYYGTHHGETSTWNMEIDKDDEETLYALRRLAIWMGDVYVREPSGSGYWASISVSFSQKHCVLTIPVTLDIKRVEGGA